MKNPGKSNDGLEGTFPPVPAGRCGCSQYRYPLGLLVSLRLVGDTPPSNVGHILSLFSRTLGPPSSNDEGSGSEQLCPRHYSSATVLLNQYTVFDLPSVKLAI